LVAAAIGYTASDVS